MAKGPGYKVKYRRRKRGKTKYKKRLNLLKSGKPRLVIRKSNKYILAQLIEYNPGGDCVLVRVNSKELKERFKWEFSLENIPAAYLTGLLCGHRCKKKGIKESILDLGLHPPIKGSRVYSALKGAVDAGLTIPHSEEVFPDEKRIRGEHIRKEDITKNFEKSRKLIEAKFLSKKK